MKKVSHKLKFFLLGFLLFGTHTNLFADEQTKRIEAHLILLDGRSAYLESLEALEKNDKRQDLFELYLKSLALLGDEQKLITGVCDYIKLFPDSKNSDDMIELVCWGMIDHASQSTLPAIRFYALLGAVFANDAKSLNILKRGMSDPNSLIRAAAIRLAPNFRDLKIQKELLRLLKEEPSFGVRLEVIKAFGVLNLKESKSELLPLIEKEEGELEEKIEAISSLVQLKDGVKREEIARLVTHKKAIFRLLAVELILEKELIEDIDLIIPLLQDNRREIRKAVLKTLGALCINDFKGRKVAPYLTPLLKDIDWQVSLYAAYVLLLNQENAGREVLFSFLFDEKREKRLLAAALLSKSGQVGISLMKEVFHKTSDPYVKMNLSIGLIGQQEEVSSSLKTLYKGLRDQKELFLFMETDDFRYLAPASLKTAKTEDLIPNEREAASQLAKLEILNILSLMQFEQAEEAIKTFLQQNSWGISALASSLLLSEGDESAIELVENLLKEPNEKIRIQAALILSLWDSGHEGLSILENSYKSAEREMKERILEAIGRIGSKSSIPFLLDCLKEPFWQLRLLAAASLLQTLNH